MEIAQGSTTMAHLQSYLSAAATKADIAIISEVPKKVFGQLFSMKPIMATFKHS